MSFFVTLIITCEQCIISTIAYSHQSDSKSPLPSARASRECLHCIWHAYAFSCTPPLSTRREGCYVLSKPCGPADASQLAACGACGAASAPACARPAWPSSAPGMQLPFTCASARSAPVGPALPASAAAAAGPGAALTASGGTTLGAAGRAGPSIGRLASMAGAAAAGRPGAGAGASSSRRARCSWNAGVTQLPLQLCAPAQLKAPRRAPHLRAAHFFAAARVQLCRARALAASNASDLTHTNVASVQHRAGRSVSPAVCHAACKPWQAVVSDSLRVRVHNQACGQLH